MPALYFDHHVTARAVRALQAAGHDTRHANDIGMARAGDDEHLLLAAQNRWLLVTHDTDYLQLHDAWLRWSRPWGVTPTHAGILVGMQQQQQQWHYTQVVTQVEAFLSRQLPAENRLYQWRHRGGWTLRRL